jgi:hypothetical protein
MVHQTLTENGVIRCSIFVPIRVKVKIALIRGEQTGMEALSTVLFAIPVSEEMANARCGCRYRRCAKAERICPYSFSGIELGGENLCVWYLWMKQGYRNRMRSHSSS